MKIETFQLERTQSLWENSVKYNLTESGIHPYTLEELLSKKELQSLLSVRLGYCQTNGTDALREEVSHLYPGSRANSILITNGSSEANFLTIWSFLDPGDELIMMLPNYMQIWGIARSFGVNVKPFHLKEELQWAPDLKELESRLTSRTKMIAVCNPNNPTGAVLSIDHMKDIIHLAKKVDSWIYSDEVYRGAELDTYETPSFFNMYEKVLVTGGLSKSYALPGLRIGWLVGPEKNIEKLWSSHDYTSIAPGKLSNFIAELVLQPDKRKNILFRTRKILNENLSLLHGWVKSQDNLISFVPPKAGGIAFLRYHLNINSTELTERLREEKSVFVAAGDFFGMDHFLRVGIGAEKDYLSSGLDLIRQTFDEITGAQ